MKAILQRYKLLVFMIVLVSGAAYGYKQYYKKKPDKKITAESRNFFPCRKRS